MNRKIAVCFLLTVSAAGMQAQDHWVATWTTAQPLFRNPPRVPPSAAAAAPTNTPQPNAPAAAPQRQFNGIRSFNNQTVRMIVNTSIGGSKVRLRLSNSFGGTPVIVGTAHVAVHSKDSEIVPASDRAVSFNGKPGCTIGPGQVIVSDPVDMRVVPQSALAVSLYFPADTGAPAAHNALHTSYISKEGDTTAAAAFTEPTTAANAYWLEGVDVLAPANASLIVALGDSITEGYASTRDTDRTWPAVLSARLAANKATAEFAVGNVGIGGNRILRDGSGASVLARFDRDVLSQPGVKWVVFLEGINDIGHANTDPVAADDLIGAYKQVIEQAHAHGIKVAGCTLPPYQGAAYYREEGEALREAANNFIRSGAFDAVVDFEAATKDPNNPKHIRPEFDPGDHLHPNDAGYKAMAETIDLGIFTGKPAKK